jgi:hypothetical protein
MTVERKIIIGLEDIKAVVFECTSCLSRVSIPPQARGNTRIPNECPQCSAKWSVLDPLKYGDQISLTPHANLVTSIERLKSFSDELIKMAGFKILFELEEPVR